MVQLCPYMTTAVWWWNAVLRPHYQVINRAFSQLIICRNSRGFLISERPSYLSWYLCEPVTRIRSNDFGRYSKFINVKTRSSNTPPSMGIIYHCTLKLGRKKKSVKPFLFYNYRNVKFKHQMKLMYSHVNYQVSSFIWTLRSTNNWLNAQMYAFHAWRSRIPSS